MTMSRVHYSNNGGSTEMFRGNQPTLQRDTQKEHGNGSMLKNFLMICIFFVVVWPALANAGNPMVHQEGTRLIDENGQVLFLQGVNIEGWLTWPGHCWGGEFVSETQVREHILAKVGAEATKKFERAVYTNFIAEQDIKMMSQFGFNVVRVLFNHEILEKDARPYKYKESGWQIFDQLIRWCEKYHVYLVPCLISAPGGQSKWFISDPDKKLLWDDPENQRRTIALWKAIAARYRDRKIIAGYELLNEPSHVPLRLIDLYKRTIQAIREVDPHHMIILDGTRSASDFSMFSQPLTDNQMYSYHVYHLVARRLIPDKSAELVEKMKQLSLQHEVPLWASEFGAHTQEWTSGALKMFEAPESGLSGWAFWPWKRVPSKHSEKDYMHLAAIRPSPGWVTFINGVGKKWVTSKFSKEEALQAMDAFTEAIKAENLDFDNQMLRVLAPAK